MKKFVVIIFALILVITFFEVNAEEENKFYSWAKTPFIGWNNWDCYGPTFKEKKVKANADYMAKHLKKYRWQYIVIDIRWYVENPKAHGYNEKSYY